MYWLTQATVTRSHFEFGSGTSLQPLLRFSDRFSENLFVDFDLSGAAVRRHILQGVEDLEREACALQRPSPLVIEATDLREGLQVRDFELAASPQEVPGRVAELLTPREQREYRYFSEEMQGRRVSQWGLEVRLMRQIPHVDGHVERRPLTLRLVGGEGLMSYIGMGGDRRPPASVGSIQTGVLEEAGGPLARYFSQQVKKGLPIPEVWVRGHAHDTGFLAWMHRQRQVPAHPFSHVGQCFAGWTTDRRWPRAEDRRRDLKAWVREAPSRARRAHLGLAQLPWRRHGGTGL